MKKENATFAMGCFWKPDILFSKIPGVVKTEVGYIGGDEKKYPKPSYEQVCSGKTGYAEVVNIEFDSDKVSFEKLLEIFWGNHNPTSMNRQGPDVGTQYRSAIFCHSEEQRKKATESKKKEQKRWPNPIVTEIVKAGTFFKAEDYHQKYLDKNKRAVC